MKGKAIKSIYISRVMVWGHGLDLMKDCFTCTGLELIVKR